MPRLTTATAVVVLLSALCRGFDDAASPDVAERPPSSSCGLSSVGAGGSLQLACGFEATVTLTALVPEDGSKSPIHIRPILPEGCALSVSPTRGLVDSASPSVSFTVRAHSSAAPRLSSASRRWASRAAGAASTSLPRSHRARAARSRRRASCSSRRRRTWRWARPRSSHTCSPATGRHGDGVATLQHVALTLSAKAEENGRGAALAPVRLVHRGGACGDGRKNKDDRDEFDCELTREKCAATFSLIGAGRGAVRVVATTQPVWDRPSTGKQIALPERQDGSKQYDTTVAVGNDRDQDVRKDLHGVRRGHRLHVPAQGASRVEAAGRCPPLPSRSASASCSAPPSTDFGRTKKGRSPAQYIRREEQEHATSLLDLFDGKETKDKETSRRPCVRATG